MMNFQAVAYRPGTLILLDQTRLPTVETYVELTDVEAIAQAIETLVVRGAPAIGVAAAYGIAVAAHRGVPLAEADTRLRRTRPTAVNLMWALDQMAAAAAKDPSPKALDQAAQGIFDDDAAACARIGALGAELVPDGARILTHCNAGALATSLHGTALAVIRAAHAQGKRIKVYADETRPVLQGARLTAWELHRDGIDVTVIPDGAAAHFLGRDELDLAVVGADRIARNGDAANKIGTRGVACACYAHGRPFYVAAPWSTVDLSKSSGAQIPIELRDPREVTHLYGHALTPAGVKALNPAFDVTPARWITEIITERGRTGAPVGPGMARLSGE